MPTLFNQQADLMPTDVPARIQLFADKIYSMEPENHTTVMPYIIGALKGQAKRDPESLAEAIGVLEAAIESFEEARQG